MNITQSICNLLDQASSTLDVWRSIQVRRLEMSEEGIKQLDALAPVIVEMLTRRPKVQVHACECGFTMCMAFDADVKCVKCGTSLRQNSEGLTP